MEPSEAGHVIGVLVAEVEGSELVVLVWTFELEAEVIVSMPDDEITLVLLVLVAMDVGG